MDRLQKHITELDNSLCGLRDKISNSSVRDVPPSVPPPASELQSARSELANLSVENNKLRCIISNLTESHRALCDLNPTPSSCPTVAAIPPLPIRPGALVDPPLGTGSTRPPRRHSSRRVGRPIPPAAVGAPDHVSASHRAPAVPARSSHFAIPPPAPAPVSTSRSSGPRTLSPRKAGDVVYGTGTSRLPFSAAKPASGPPTGIRPPVAPDECLLFISGIHTDTTARTIFEYCAAIVPSTLKVSKVRTRHDYASFVVTVPSAFSSLLLEPTRWGPGMLAKVYSGDQLPMFTESYDGSARSNSE